MVKELLKYLTTNTSDVTTIMSFLRMYQYEQPPPIYRSCTQLAFPHREGYSTWKLFLYGQTV